MLVQNLSITYKCYSSIGNSLDIKEMMYEVLRTFVSETYASYALFTLTKDNKEKEITSFGKVDKFDLKNFKNYTDAINRVKDNDRIVVILRLKYGSIYLLTQNIDVDCTFFISMFESFIHKLNLSIESCLNVQKMHEANLLLEEQKEKLKLANKSKDDFLANMSHELKTPLNSINVISSIMKKNKNNNLTDKQIKNLEIINKSGQELFFLVNDVLDLAKLEAGEITLNYSNIDVEEFIKNIYESILPQTKAKNLNFILKIDETLDYIYSDKNRINQIIKNLLSNSLKFTKEGDIKLSVKNSKDNIVIKVKDDGIGIEQNKLINIFDRFKQADGSTTRKFGGTGLGLAICKELALLLKGDIKVKSKLYEGSEFKLIIPKNLEHAKIPTSKVSNEDTDIKDDILVLNNNPLYFFNIIIKLDKKYNVIQKNDFESFITLLLNNKNRKNLIDLTNLNYDQISKLKKQNISNTIFIYENEIDEYFLQNAFKTIKKIDFENSLEHI